MLVLTRRIGESIMACDFDASDDVEFMILGVKGNQVRIGIAAPQNVTLERKELRTRPNHTSLRERARTRRQ